MTRGTTRYPHRDPANDVLEYAILIGITTTTTVTMLMITLDAPIVRTVLMMSVLGGVWTFTITPYIVAYWLNRDIDELLDTPA